MRANLVAMTQLSARLIQMNFMQFTQSVMLHGYPSRELLEKVTGYPSTSINFGLAVFTTQSIYSLVPKIETYKSGIANQDKLAL